MIKMGLTRKNLCSLTCSRRKKTRIEVIIEKIFKTNMQILVFFKKASSILLILMVLVNNKINVIKNKIRIDDIHIIPM